VLPRVPFSNAAQEEIQYIYTPFDDTSADLEMSQNPIKSQFLRRISTAKFPRKLTFIILNKKPFNK
jgi:hypothetical protein